MAPPRKKKTHRQTNDNDTNTPAVPAVVVEVTKEIPTETKTETDMNKIDWNQLQVIDSDKPTRPARKTKHPRKRAKKSSAAVGTQDSGDEEMKFPEFSEQGYGTRSMKNDDWVKLYPMYGNFIDLNRLSPRPAMMRYEHCIFY